MTKGSGSLRNKYSVVGIGETEFSRNSGRTTRAMGSEAIKKAIDDSGLDYLNTSWGITCYAAGGDAAGSESIASDVGIRLDYQVDTSGGGKTQKGTEYSCYKAQREISLCFWGHFPPL